MSNNKIVKSSIFVENLKWKCSKIEIIVSKKNWFNWISMKKRIQNETNIKHVRSINELEWLMKKLNRSQHWLRIIIQTTIIRVNTSIENTIFLNNGLLFNLVNS